MLKAKMKVTYYLMITLEYILLLRARLTQDIQFIKAFNNNYITIFFLIPIDLTVAKILHYTQW